jgi:uncharacterized pyridoxamine 5'-phosphate oxidase family protein
MNYKDAIDFANKVRDCSMATVEDGNPRVRMMGLWFASEEGFYFQAWNYKNVDIQLRKNPNVEVCFFATEGEAPHRMMRVRGEVEFLEDASLREKMFKDRPFLTGLGATGPADPRLSIFRIGHGNISFWPAEKGNKSGLEIIDF